MPSSLRRARYAVTAIFLVTGVIFGTWAARIPAVSSHLHLSPGMLGVALFGLEGGAIIGLPLGGVLTTRLGTRRTTQIGLLVYCLSLPLVGLAPDLLFLTGLLALFAAGNSFLDVAMNVEGVAVEQRYQRPILSSFHAFWSIGGLVGSILGAGAATIEMAVPLHFTLISVFWLIIGFAATYWFLSEPPKQQEKLTFAWPKRAILLLGVIAFCAFLTEGVMNGWSTVYLHDSVGAPSGLAALGYTVYTFTMAGGRLLADSIVARIGPRWFVGGASLLIAVGLGLALLLATPVMALIGFGVLGAGVAGIAPIILSEAGHREPGDRKGPTIAAVSSIGYLGSLSGPVLIGWLAQLSSLRMALCVVIVLALSMAILSRKLGQHF